MASVRRWAAYAVLSGVDSTLAGVDRPWAVRVRRFTKPALMPVLAATLRPPVRSPISGALAGSWLGDVGLLVPGTTGLLTGIGGFAAAHIAYLRAIDGMPRSTESRRPLQGVGPHVVLSLPGIALSPTLSRATRGQLLRGIALVGYARLVRRVGVQAWNRGTTTPAPGGRAVAAGGVLFVVSDSLVALSMFGRRSSSVVGMAAMATYTAAQGLLCANLSDLSSTEVG